MDKLLFVFLSLLLNVHLVRAQTLSIHVDDKASLQRGAKIFMNYCSGCHSLKYLRYNRMAKDLGLTTFDGQVDEGLLKNNLIFTQASINDPIQIAMPAEDAKQWFGTVPPDLSLIAREKGSMWLYTYLKSFYSDKAKPFGANNLLMPDVAMPNMPASLMGEMTLVQNKAGHSSLLLVKPGELSQAEFDRFLQDLVTFLVYTGEPNQSIRYHLGFFVMVFLFLFLILVFSLKKVYWRKLD